MFLTQLSNVDPSRPTFFEMIAQERMLAAFKPAIKYTLTIIAQRRPAFIRLVEYHEELMLLAALFFESHYLKHYDATFSENFYGLRRAKAAVNKSKLTNNNSEDELTPLDRHVSLVLTVVVPYVKAKLDNFYKDLTGNPTSLLLPNSIPIDSTRDLTLWKRIYVQAYPLLNASYEALFFIYQLLYIFNYIKFYTPFLHLQKLEVKRLSLKDMVTQARNIAEKRAKSTEQIKSNSFIASFLKIFIRVTYSIADYAKYILPLSIFFFRFFEWWYAENRIQTRSLPIPPPPDPPSRAVGGIAIPVNKNICPICNNIRTNTTMTTSGYVFCYPCIKNYVDVHARCPITHIPMSADQLRKIYEEH